MRAISVITGIGMFYWSISLIPLAEATAITFVAPLVTTSLSPLMLGEKIGLRRWIAVLVGFGGILIVLRPEFSGDRLGYLIAFGAGIMIGVFYTFNRLLAGKAPPLVNQTYSSVIGVLLLTPFIFSVWVPLRPDDIILVLGFCAIAALGQTCLFTSFLHGEASILAPLTLSQIVFATLFGYLFFNNFPDTTSVVGIIIVIASAIYIAIRETRVR
jgi:drug/metabolite transporter (DMT)-like permease